MNGRKVKKIGILPMMWCVECDTRENCENVKLFSANNMNTNHTMEIKPKKQRRLCI